MEERAHTRSRLTRRRPSVYRLAAYSRRQKSPACAFAALKNGHSAKISNARVRQSTLPPHPLPATPRLPLRPLAATPLHPPGVLRPRLRLPGPLLPEHRPHPRERLGSASLQQRRRQQQTGVAVRTGDAAGVMQKWQQRPVPSQGRAARCPLRARRRRSWPWRTGSRGRAGRGYGRAPSGWACEGASQTPNSSSRAGGRACAAVRIGGGPGPWARPAGASSLLRPSRAPARPHHRGRRAALCS